MTNELVETSPETETIGEEVTTPEVVSPDATDGAEKPAEPAKTPEQIEVERLRRALTKRDRTQGRMNLELDQLKAERAQWAQRQPAQQQDEPATTPITREVFEREVKAEAARVAAQEQFNTKCNSVAERGKKEFSDFSETLSTLIEEAGPLVDQSGRATALGEQLLEADDTHKLINYLGKHPEIAAELDGLTHARLARKLAAIEQEMATKPKTSAAPKPLEPLNVKAAAAKNLGDPTLTDKEYAEIRRRQIAQRR